MLHVTIENKYGEQLALTGNNDYILLSVSGLTPPTATINTTVIQTMDGAAFNSSRLNTRNIVLTILPQCNVEKNRIGLYKYIKSKQYIKLYLKNGRRNVWIDGYIESVDGNLYEKSQQIQVSIICPDPMFKTVNETYYSFSNVVDKFKFPFAIDADGVPISEVSEYQMLNVVNDSDDETGVIIELTATGKIVEPKIHNTTTGDVFQLNFEMLPGDLITINTRKGNKGVTLTREGVTTNIINKVERGSSWFNLLVGDNIFAYETVYGSNSLNVTIRLQTVYEGV